MLTDGVVSSLGTSVMGPDDQISTVFLCRSITKQFLKTMTNSFISRSSNAGQAGIFTPAQVFPEGK